MKKRLMVAYRPGAGAPKRLPCVKGAFGAVQTWCFKRNFTGFHTPSKASDRSRGPGDVLGSTQYVTKCLRALPAKLQGTSKNSPFAIWADLCPQLFIAKIPQYTKYSGISATQFECKSLAQIIKKEFLEVAFGIKNRISRYTAYPENNLYGFLNSGLQHCSDRLLLPGNS